MIAGARGGAEYPARSVLARAIDAEGGAEALARLKGATFAEAGTAYGKDGTPRPASARLAILLPDKVRYEGHTPDGLPLTLVVDGKLGWVKKGDRTEEMKASQRASEEELMYLLRVTSLVPLLDPAFRLTDLGPSSVDGRTVLGIKVSSPGHPDVQLFFDKDSGLLHKLTTRSTDFTGEQYDREEFTWDYRDVGGIKAAMYFKILQNGKPRVEMKLSDFRCAEQLDDRLFAKP
jgi:hypothetical protein